MWIAKLVFFGALAAAGTYLMHRDLEDERELCAQHPGSIFRPYAMRESMCVDATKHLIKLHEQ